MRKLKSRGAVLLVCAAAFAPIAGCRAGDDAGNSRSVSVNTNVNRSVARDLGPPARATPTPVAPRGPQMDAHGHLDTARRITVTELARMIERGEAVAVDVRSPEAYQQSRIKGAILMPSDEVRARAKELPRDKLLVFYCA